MTNVQNQQRNQRDHNVRERSLKARAQKIKWIYAYPASESDSYEVDTSLPMPKSKCNN